MSEAEILLVGQTLPIETRKVFDLLPLESAFFSSLCSGFGPLLTFGDTPTG
jgi:hypothetical protein